MKTLGKVLGGIGAVLLLTAPFTWYVLRAAPYATLYAGIKVGLGLAMIAFWIVRGREPGDQRAFFYYVTSGMIALIVVVLGFGANYIADKRLKTYDWTTKKINSLAPQTEADAEGAQGAGEGPGLHGHRQPRLRRAQRAVQPLRR